MVRRDGVARLTLEAAAREAGVSKGGVLYHFPTRDALVTAMIEAVVARYDEQIAAAATGRAPGRFTRGYLQATFDDDAEDPGGALGAALLAAAAAEPELLRPLQRAAARWQRSVAADGLPAARATAIRLACDGLWLSELFGLGRLPAALRGEVAAELARWAGTATGPSPRRGRVRLSP